MVNRGIWELVLTVVLLIFVALTDMGRIVGTEHMPTFSTVQTIDLRKLIKWTFRTKSRLSPGHIMGPAGPREELARVQEGRELVPKQKFECMASQFIGNIVGKSGFVNGYRIIEINLNRAPDDMMPHIWWESGRAGGVSGLGKGSLTSDQGRLRTRYSKRTVFRHKH